MNQPAWKRPLYFALTTFLGVLLSYVVHAIIEILYLAWAVKNNKPITWTLHFGVGPCALPPVLQYGLVVLGLVGGWFLGQTWWRIVYIEHRGWHHSKHKH